LVALDTTWYISSRARDEGRYGPRRSDSLEFGAVIIEREPLDDPLDSRIPFRRVDSLTFSRAEFIASLRARMATTPLGPQGAPDRSPFAVLYTHGYATSLEEAWQHTSTSRTRSRSRGPWVVFAWPSIGSGMAWTRGSDLVAAAYGRDSTAAMASLDAYAIALNTVREATGNGGLMVVTHSLGARVAGSVLTNDLALRESLRIDPLRAIAFFSPDVAAGQFADTLVPALRGLSRRLLLYATSDDRALAIAENYNRGPRAGRFREEAGSPLVRDGLESVDMTDGADADNLLLWAFGPRHALRRRSAALFDLVHIVAQGFAPECRETLGTATRLSTGAWKLTAQPVPEPDAVSRCSAPVTPDEQVKTSGAAATARAISPQ